ncbi:hypothetical protein BGW39_007177 [Mortierella sp. 14UC]|nr:hypothetical protein BGW39_007177 [Mortierella sp. 14UC]
MHVSYILPSIALLASAFMSSAQAGDAITESMSSHDNFIVPDGYGPDRRNNADKHKCDFDRSEELGYGHYSIDVIVSNVVGPVTSFFLIANEDTEIDIELTGLNTKVGWMNIWHDRKQNPISIDLPFDAADGWHTYSFEWRKNFVPDDTNYRLAINSWTQVNPEININWAGQFQYPEDGKTPSAQSRNMRYRL